MAIDLEAETRSNSKDIQALTVTVTRMVAMQENTEKRHDSSMETIKAAMSGIEQLNQRMSATIGMEKDIKTLTEQFSERTADIRTIRHDVNNINNAMNGMPILNDKIADNSRLIATINAKVETLETRCDKMDGAFAATRTMAIAFWAMFGTSIIGGVAYMIHFFATRP